MNSTRVFGRCVVRASANSLPLIPGGPADVLTMFSGSPPLIALPAAALGLGPTDDVTGLEVLGANP
ncbi:MAG: hypothetical protein AABY85_06360, partial [Gemmatimonadota bacterium]